MADVTAAMVKELRDKTGAGMMDAKAALVENQGDMDNAVDWLRKKGLSKAAKKSGRVAAEGVIAVATSADGKTASLVEVNSETDFVARNEQFQNFAAITATRALEVSDVEALGVSDFGNGKNVQETLTELIATIGENMNLRRSTRLSVTDGFVATYIHNAVGPNIGKIGVLVALESTASHEKLRPLGKQLAMHIAAAKPEALDIANVDPRTVEREKAIHRDTARASGKPDDIIEKMLEGRMRKYYEEIVLNEQTFIMDGETKIADLIAKATKESGAPVKIHGFITYVLGEGIEKEETDFAAEVAKVVNG